MSKMINVTLEQLLNAYSSSKSLKNVLDLYKHNMTDEQINIFKLAIKEIKKKEK